MTDTTLSSICDACRGPIAITAEPGQRWDELQWQHTDPKPVTTHRAVPELRFVIDADCPGCNLPEVGFAPARSEFVCSRCGWTGEERPS
jgi:ribosomal protein S27E